MERHLMAELNHSQVITDQFQLQRVGIERVNHL